MDLEDFVASTLTQISAGIAKAQQQAAASGAWINPSGKLGADKSRPRIEVDLGAAVYLETVEFDVAVTVATDQTAQAGGGIRVVGIQLGAAAETNYVNSSVSRVKFSVPIAWPDDRDPDLEAKRNAAREEQQRNAQSQRGNFNNAFKRR